MSRLWGRLSFSVKFAVIIVVTGGLIAIVPLVLASQQNGSQATERASDKAGVIVNLVGGQERSLAAFAAGMTQELGPSLTGRDQATVSATLVRYSQVNTPSDMVGVHGPLGDTAVVGGKPVMPTDPLFTSLAQQAARAPSGVLPGPDGSPWLVGSSRLSTTSEIAFIARPITAAFIQALAGTITTSADKWDPLESTCRHASLSIL